MELIREKGIPYCDGKGGLQMERGSRYRPIYAEKDRSDSSSSTRVASDNDTSPPQTLLFRRGEGKGRGVTGFRACREIHHQLTKDLVPINPGIFITQP